MTYHPYLDNSNPRQHLYRRFAASISRDNRSRNYSVSSQNQKTRISGDHYRPGSSRPRSHTCEPRSSPINVASHPREDQDLKKGEILDRPRLTPHSRVDILRRNKKTRSYKRGVDDEQDRETKVSRATWATDVTASRRQELFRNPRMLIDKNNCRPGTVFTAVIYEPLLDHKILNSHLKEQPDRRLIDAGADGWYIRKDRPWIVTAVYEDSYQAIAVYSHNGLGLESRRGNEQLVREYVNVIDKAAPETPKSSGNMAEQNEVYEPLKIEDLYDDYRWSSKSYAWLTYPVSRRFTGKAVIIGKLEHHSVERLMQLLQSHAAWLKPQEKNTWTPSQHDLEEHAWYGSQAPIDGVYDLPDDVRVLSPTVSDISMTFSDAGGGEGIEDFDTASYQIGFPLVDK